MRLLKRTTQKTMPANMVFYDTETSYEPKGKGKIVHTLRLGVAVHWRNRQDGKASQTDLLRFKDKNTFWDWCLQYTRPNMVLYLVAHNIGFDLMVVDGFNQLTTRGYRLIFMYEAGHTRIVRFGKPSTKFSDWLAENKPPDLFKGKRWHHTLTCLDNSNWFAGKLSRWGASLNLPKLTMPDDEEGDETWFIYCERDVVIMVELWKNWLAFLEKHRLGAWRQTVPSQAFTAYRHRFMHHKIWLHDDKRATRLERQAYFGGRCEPWQVGKIDQPVLYKVDINSMYPYVMHSQDYPVALVEYVDRPKMADLVNALDKFAVVASVRMQTNEAVYPVRVNNHNVYPTGTFDATLCTPELKYAVENGHLMGVEHMAVYRTRPIFKEFVEYFYRLKLEYGQVGDSLNRNLIKLMLNSLYGKFGQRGFDTSWLHDCENDVYEVEHVTNVQTGKRYTIYRAGGSVIRSEHSGEGRNSFVAIAAHVTSYARMYLWHLIRMAGNPNVYYMDTDSLIVNRLGLERLSTVVDDEKLGFLKIEDIATNVVIYAPKDYVVDGHVKRKGVPANSKQIASDRWEVTIWPSIKGSLGSGVTDHYENRVVEKHLKRTVRWGVLVDKNRVRPFNLPGDVVP